MIDNKKIVLIVFVIAFIIFLIIFLNSKKQEKVTPVENSTVVTTKDEISDTYMIKDTENHLIYEGNDPIESEIYQMDPEFDLQMPEF